jgi:four helix bundle protein
MLKNFRAYQAALAFYRLCESVRGPAHLTTQLLRAAAGVPLNLAEGSERVTDKDRRRCYRIALGSIRECEAALALLPVSSERDEARKALHGLGGTVWKLCASLDQKSKKQTAFNPET